MKMKQSFIETLSLIKSDMQARATYESKTLNTVQMIKFLLNTAILSSIIYRFQTFFYCNHLQIVASILSTLNGIIFTVHIDPSTKIGAGFFMMHANYICIGSHVNIGKNCMLAHQNTICPSPFFSEKVSNSAKGPTIGDDFMMGGGAGVYGDITLGEHVKVSMNAAVEESFPDNATLFGVPARNMAKQTANVATS